MIINTKLTAKRNIQNNNDKIILQALYCFQMTRFIKTILQTYNNRKLINNNFTENIKTSKKYQTNRLVKLLRK